MSRVMRAAAVLTAVAGAAAAQASLGAAEDTGISGQVESVVALSLVRPAPGRVEATVTATVDRTQLSVTAPGRDAQTLRTFSGPVVGRKVTVPSAAPPAGATTRQLTITFGPQGP